MLEATFRSHTLWAGLLLIYHHRTLCSAAAQAQTQTPMHIQTHILSGLFLNQQKVTQQQSF